MKADEFCRWLQGFAELSANAPSDEQWKSIKEHLQLVFVKVTPPVGQSPMARAAIDAIHSSARIC